jgi:predicted TIM-barrel fold metal-dependent hydrolase
MNRLLSIISCSLLPLYVLVHSPASTPAHVTRIAGYAKAETYYTLQDFSQVKKFDSHIHLNTLEPTFIKLAQRNNFHFLDIVDDRPFGLPMAGQEEIAVQDLKSFPQQMAFATTFSVKDWNDADWAEKTIESLKHSFANGAKAVKIWKNIGMSLRDKDGKFVMVDDRRLDPVLDYLEKNRIPLVGHNGEPRDCWLPLDKMTFSQDYYGAHPEYHMYLHPEYPSYMDQINARDNMLKKHPNLQFIGAHLGSLEWSLDELGKRLDLYPNMRVDLSRMTNLQLHALRDRQKTRNFFIKYQDRLVYGTDQAINAAADPAKLEQRVKENWMEDWKFFVTDDKLSLERFGDLIGLKLSKQVIDKIYYSNAQKWLSGLPVKEQ